MNIIVCISTLMLLAGGMCHNHFRFHLVTILGNQLCCGVCGSSRSLLSGSCSKSIRHSCTHTTHTTQLNIQHYLIEIIEHHHPNDCETCCSDMICFLDGLIIILVLAGEILLLLIIYPLACSYHTVL